MTRSVRAGQSIRLRTQFKDDLGEPVQANDVYIHIFEPEEDYTDLSVATLVSGIPTYLGEGIYEYEYSVPLASIEGYWQDLWIGTLTTQTLNNVFTFEVVTSGVILPIDQQLHNNNLVSLTIASGLMATDGTSLNEEYTSEFLTTTTPSYTNIRKVRLSIGGFISNLEDDVIQTAILESSLEADILTFATETTNNDLYEHARREYTTCLVANTLLTNLNNSSLRAKTLGDLHVEYDTNGVRDMLDKIQDCVSKWAPQLITGGGVGAARAPSMVIKGALDPDRPIASRMWESTEDGLINRHMPAANTREKPTGKRRHLRTYKNKWRW